METVHQLQSRPTSHGYRPCDFPGDSDNRHLRNTLIVNDKMDLWKLKVGFPVLCKRLEFVRVNQEMRSAPSDSLEASTLRTTNRTPPYAISVPWSRVGKGKNRWWVISGCQLPRACLPTLVCKPEKLTTGSAAASQDASLRVQGASESPFCSTASTGRSLLLADLRFEEISVSHSTRRTKISGPHLTCRGVNYHPLVVCAAKLEPPNLTC